MIFSLSAPIILSPDGVETDAEVESLAPTPSFYTDHEELWHTLTHGAGIAAALVGATFLLTLAGLFGGVDHVVAFGVYGVMLVVLFTASTLYHGTRRPKIKHRFRILDHASIYAFIAGTMTPFLLLGRDGVDWVLLAAVWGLALGGMLLKVFFLGRFEALTVGLYLGMGWGGAWGISRSLGEMPVGFWGWLVGGGVAFTVGVVFYLWGRRYSHVIWHLFVLAGCLCHYLAIAFYLAPWAPEAALVA